MLRYGEGKNYPDSISAIQASYDSKITDEFILPAIIGEPAPIQNGDAVLTMNFRADRMRQIVRAVNETNSIVASDENNINNARRCNIV